MGSIKLHVLVDVNLGVCVCGGGGGGQMKEDDKGGEGDHFGPNFS